MIILRGRWCQCSVLVVTIYLCRTDNIVLDETMPYAHNRKLRLTPEADNLQDSSAANLTLIVWPEWL